MSQLAKVFALNREGFNLTRGLQITAAVIVTVGVVIAVDQEVYLLSVLFGLLFVALSDPGGGYADRLRPMAGVGLIGALLTGLGFGLGTDAWGWVVLAVFVVTLLCGLAVKYGLHNFVAGLLLNVWFVIALSAASGYQQGHVTTHAWAQALAWLIGAAAWISLTFVAWLGRGRQAQPSHFPEIPGDTSPQPLTRPLILFAVIRAVALAIAVAIAFGFHLPNADWMPIATLIAMKPSLEQSALVAEQRLAGTLLGAALAAVFLLTLDNKHALEVVIVILVATAATIRGVNYALYCTAAAALVLIAMDLPHPTNFTAEGQRVLFTLAGVGIAVAVMFLANLLQKRTTPTAATTT